MKNLLTEKNLQHLDKIGDEHGEHGEGEAEDVEERERYEGLLWGELVIRVVDVDERVGSKGHQRHLQEIIKTALIHLSSDCLH